MDDRQQIPEQLQKPLPNRTQYMADRDNFVPPVKPKHILGVLIKILLIVVLVVAAAGAAYWFATHHSKTPGKSANAPSKTTPVTSQAASVTKITSATKHYDSSNYNLGFDYPEDWTISDTPNNKLTATSPAVQLRGAGGQAFTGQIVFSIQPKQTSVSQFAAGKTVAALESQKIAYKSPTSSQRAQTYVSFVSYNGDSSNLDGLYITGDNGYQADQDVPMSDIAKADPLVSITFLKCADADCKTTPSATSLPTSDWSDTGLSTPLLTMIKSLVIE